MSSHRRNSDFPQRVVLSVIIIIIRYVGQLRAGRASLDTDNLYGTRAKKKKKKINAYSFIEILQYLQCACFSVYRGWHTSRSCSIGSAGIFFCERFFYFKIQPKTTVFLILTLGNRDTFLEQSTVIGVVLLPYYDTIYGRSLYFHKNVKRKSWTVHGHVQGTKFCLNNIYTHIRAQRHFLSSSRTVFLQTIFTRFPTRHKSL